MTHAEAERREDIQRKIAAVHHELESAAFRRGAEFVLKRMPCLTGAIFKTREGKWLQDQLRQIMAEVEREIENGEVT